MALKFYKFQIQNYVENNFFKVEFRDKLLGFGTSRNIKKSLIMVGNFPFPNLPEGST